MDTKTFMHIMLRTGVCMCLQHHVGHMHCMAVLAGKKSTSGEVLGIASSDDHAGNALHVSVSFSVLDISVVDHLPEELVAVTIKGLSCGVALGIGPEGTFQRMQLSVQKLQIDDQLSASRCCPQCSNLQRLCHACCLSKESVRVHTGMVA